MTTNQSEQFQQQQEEEETEELNLNKKIFKFDRSYQEKIVQSMVMDQPWASQFLEVLELDYFGYAYLKLVASCYVDYYKEYKEFPSQELLLTIIKDKLKASSDAILTEQVKGLLKRIASNKDLGDLIFVKSQSLSWCKKMALTKALDKSITYAENEDDHEKIVTVIQKAITAGNSHTSGLDLLDDIDARYSETYRQTIPTGIKELDQRKILNGGLGAGELGIVVAPTGCHAKNEDIIMFDGTIKKSQNVQIGDLLIGPDLMPRIVLATHTGIEELYTVIQARGELEGATKQIFNANHELHLLKPGLNRNLPDSYENVSIRDYLSRDSSLNEGLKWTWIYTTNKEKYVYTTDFRIESSGIGEYYGWTVDGDNLYLANDFSVLKNCGKSHLLVHIGAQAILQGKNVAHYTFELNERNMGIRYDSHILGINSTDCFEHKDVIKKFYKENEDTLGTLRIKYYSSAVASVMTLRAHLQKLATTGFRPDMVLVDYAGIMRSADRNDLLRIELKKVCEELRAFADELQVPVWTALQSNKEGASSEVVDLTNMAESYAQAHVADFVVGLSRQSSQKSKGFGNIFIAKNRAGMDGVKYPIHLDTARSFLKVLTADEVGDFLGDIEDEKKDDAVSIVRRTYRDQVNNTKIKH